MKLFQWPSTRNQRAGEDRPVLPPKVKLMPGHERLPSKGKRHAEMLLERLDEAFMLRAKRDPASNARRRVLSAAADARITLLRTLGVSVPADRDVVRALLKRWSA